MKAWPDDHPKAKLMARKRAAILDAARDVFLRVGYEGASMESIAAAAGVSIMTLYRHAESKDDLFEAVILSACTYSHDPNDADSVALTRQPLRDVLVTIGNLFQEKLTKAETVSLFRAVMAETGKFPHLAKAAYRSFVEEWEVNLDGFLAERAEFREIAAPLRRTLIAGFIDDLVGTGALRALLGLDGSSTEERVDRSQAAAERLLNNLPSNPA